MPYAQVHYPFENKELIDDKKYYPADFIAEGVDQTRGWFFTLHAIATMNFDSVAYKNVVSNGLVLDLCMGSGSLGVACKKFEKNYIGFELQPTIFENAKQRILKTIIYDKSLLQFTQKT